MSKRPTDPGHPRHHGTRRRSCFRWESPAATRTGGSKRYTQRTFLCPVCRCPTAIVAGPCGERRRPISAVHPARP
ncbi:MAG: methylenetetrahydrofolate reductase C-terminal domain-containing protein [Planctomycetes bacterium]|nr:methylenetetrahydrofolate reductase C-terminal domain-containing protein [Planctomycetota bacterium]